MGDEKVLEFNCPLKMKIVLPRDCAIDEDALRRRIETAGPQLFKGFCDGCPHHRARK